MSSELIAVIIGATIGIVGTLGTTLILKVWENHRRGSAIRAIAASEVIAVKEKLQRFIDGKSGPDEVLASTPMLVSIASELGYLSAKQAIDFRRVVTLDMEMKKSRSKEKAVLTIDACDKALKSLSVKKNLLRA